MELGQTVTLKKDTQVGMGRLKQDAQGTIARIEKSEDGTPIYCVRFTDHKGNERTTWIS